MYRRLHRRLDQLFLPTPNQIPIRTETLDSILAAARGEATEPPEGDVEPAPPELIEEIADRAARLGTEEDDCR